MPLPLRVQHVWALATVTHAACVLRSSKRSPCQAPYLTATVLTPCTQWEATTCSQRQLQLQITDRCMWQVAFSTSALHRR